MSFGSLSNDSNTKFFNDLSVTIMKSIEDVHVYNLLWKQVVFRLGDIDVLYVPLDKLQSGFYVVGKIQNKNEIQEINVMRWHIISFNTVI